MRLPGAERRARLRAALLPPLPRSDPLLWLAAAALGVLGLAMAHSAALGAPPHPAVAPEAARHAALGAAGVAAALAAARIDYRSLRRFAAHGWLAAALLLLAVAAAGVTEYGARRWLPVGGATIQPAEAAKIALVLALAAYAASRPPRAAALAVSAALLAPIAAAVLLQPDSGTAIVLAGAWLGVVVAWGAPWRALGAAAGGAAAAVPLAFALGVPAYQRERLAVFLDPARDPLGSGFSLRMAEAALGAGGLTGEGLFGGAESRLHHVAGRSNDFVFALVGEELGLLGGLAVIVLFGLVAWRGFEAARRAPDAFGRLLAAGLTTLLLTQALVNVAVNLRLFPATGLPLPLVSSGGSALIAACVAVGLLQSVHAQRPPTRGKGIDLAA